MKGHAADTPEERDPRRVYRGVIPGQMRWNVMLREWGGEKRLHPCNNIRNHSPTGYSWGYAGSGPAQTALAILVDAIGEERALPLYQRFKEHWIATLPQNEGWELPHATVLAWAKKAEATERAIQIVEGQAAGRRILDRRRRP